MRFDLYNTAELWLLSGDSLTSMRPIIGIGPRGLPGPGAAAWVALEAITSGEVRQAPDGSWIKSIANRTTRATFDTTEAGFWTAVLATTGTVEQKALDATYGAVTLATSTADGATNVHTAFAADVAAAQAAGRVLQLKTGGTYLDSTNVQAITTSVRIDGRGATFSKNHSQMAFDIEPPPDSGAGLTTVDAVVGAVTVTISNAGAAGSKVGKRVNFGLSHAIVRTVVSNTTTTVTFNEGLGADVPSGTTCTFYTPIDLVEITDLTINDATGAGLANLVIRYAKKVRLRRVKSTNCGGNGFTIYWCDDVVVEDPETDNTNFGGFAYYCDRVQIVRPKPKNWKSSYGWQIKDCREYGTIRDGMGVGDGVNSKTAFDVKCSGLNPGRNQSISNSWAKNTTQSGLMMHCLQQEGTGFVAENTSIIGGGSQDCGTGWQALAALPYEPGEVPGTGKFVNGRVSGVQSIRSTSGGFSIEADDIDVTDIEVARGQVRGGTISSSGVRLRGRFVDNNQSGASSQELRLDGATDCDIDITVVHSDVASGTANGVRELNAADRNTIKVNVHNTDLVSPLTTSAAVSLLGASSVNGDLAARMHAALGMASDRVYTMDRITGNVSNTVTAGTAYITTFTPVVTLTISKLELSSAATAVAGATLVRFGLFTIDSSNNALLVARTANDTSLLAATNTLYSKALDTTGGYPATYVLAAGRRYGIGFIVVGSSAGTFKGASLQTSLAREAGSLFRGGQLGSGLTDLPTTSTSIANNSLLPWAAAIV